MKKVIICNGIALVLLAFSALVVQRYVEFVIGLEVGSRGIGALSYSDGLTIKIKNLNDEQIGSIRNYPVYVLAASLLMNLLFWVRRRAN